MFKKETLDKLDAFSGKDLYPIYPPAVIKHQDLIDKLSHELGAPPNVIATIMTIESAGRNNAESYVGAQGLFQVMPPHFYEEFGKEFILENPKIMTDPYTNGKIGMRFFINQCLATARKELVGNNYRKDHVSVFARALTAYNAGPGTVKDSFLDLPEETKFYGDHFIRFALTAQIAAGLRDNGYNDRQIIEALTLESNQEIDARSYVLQAFHDSRMESQKGYSYREYEQMLKELSYPSPGVNPQAEGQNEVGNFVRRLYNHYKTTPHDQYTYPLAPALRLWTAVGGLGLLFSEPSNTDKKQYHILETKRGR